MLSNLIFTLWSFYIINTFTMFLSGTKIICVSIQLWSIKSHQNRKPQADQLLLLSPGCGLSRPSGWVHWICSVAATGDAPHTGTSCRRSFRNCGSCANHQQFSFLQRKFSVIHFKTSLIILTMLQNDDVIILLLPPLLVSCFTLTLLRWPGWEQSNQSKGAWGSTVIISFLR